MAGSVVISPSSVSIVPGATGTATVRIRNTGVVVDQFSVTVLGQPAVWTTAVPAVLSLFPGAEGTIELHFAPPRAAGVGLGPVPFGVRVDASEDPDGSVVEEGEVDLLSYVDVQAKLTPRTSEAKRKARHEVLVDNRGNSPVEAEIDATDPDELLAFEVRPRTVTVAGGASAHVPVRVAARKGFLRGTDKHRPFQVKVSVGPGQGPIVLDGTLVQKPGMPRFVVPLIGFAVVVGLLAVMAPALLKKDPQSGKLALTSEEAATTTTAAPEAAPAEEPPDPNAPATAEEAAAAAEAERAANGRDADSPGGGGGGTSGGSGGGGGTEAAGGGTSTGGGTGGGGSTGSEEETVVTSPTATTAAPPPGVTTTTAPPTATTVPSKDGAVRGTFSFDFDTGTETATGADVFWQQSTSTVRALVPKNGAQLANLGPANYDTLTVAQLKAASYSTNAIDGSDASNKMPPGTVIAIKTDTGRYAKMRVTAKDAANTLTFRFYTYPAGS
jgi:hypothetical protein